MKKYAWMKYILLIPVILLVLPLLLNLLCRLAVTISESLNIPQVIQISNLSNIDFSDYAAVGVSLFSSLSVFLISYMTYRLSKSVQEYAEKQDKDKRQYTVKKLVNEINNNIQLIDSHVKKTGAEPGEICIDAFELIGNTLYGLPEEVLIKIQDLYNTFKYFEKNGQLSDCDKKQWVNPDKVNENKEVINNLLMWGMR